MIGQRALRDIWQGREAYDLKLPTRWLKLDPADLIDVAVDGVARRLLVTSVTYGQPGLVLVRGVTTDGGVPEFVTVGTESGLVPPAAAEPPGPIRVELLDTPLMIDAYALSAASFYVAACPLGPGRFRGAALFEPAADRLDYTTAAIAPVASVLGQTLWDLYPGPTGRGDLGNVFGVRLDRGELQGLPEARAPMRRWSETRCCSFAPRSRSPRDGIGSLICCAASSAPNTPPRSTHRRCSSTMPATGSRRPSTRMGLPMMPPVPSRPVSAPAR